MDPGKGARRDRLRKWVGAAARTGDVARCQRLLAGADKYDAEGVAANHYATAEATIGTKSFLRLKAPEHPLEAYVLLPPGWSPDRTWPIAVYVDGARSQFEAAAWRHRRGLDEMSFIVVVPITLSNANELKFENYPYTREALKRYVKSGSRLERIKFDVAGLTGVLARVRQKFRGRSKFSVTGYSGGGMLVYWWLHHHPEQLVAAAPASANYYSLVARGGIGKVKSDGPAVKIFTGANDAVGKKRIFPQSEEAVAAMKALGVKHVERIHLEDRAHEPFTTEVFQFFESVNRTSEGK